MKGRDQRRYDRLTRVQTFGKTNAGDFTAESATVGFFESLDDLLTHLERVRTTQIPRRVSKSALLDTLIVDFKNISRTARAITVHEHGFMVSYRPPESLTEAACLTHADALLSRLENDAKDTAEQRAGNAALRAKFSVYELGDAFVDALRANYHALKT